MTLIEGILPPTLFGRALLVALAAVVTLAIVWIIQWEGYAPCELCLTERYAFYAAVPVAAASASLANAGKGGLARAGLGLLALIFFANAVFAFYHVGVEQKWWLGPTACTGSLNGSIDLSDLANSVNSTPIVRCDEPALRVLGVSLAGWDAAASAALAIYAALAIRLRR